MRTKTSTLAGTWYPGTAEELCRQVDEFLGPADEQAGPVAGLVVPHAGYRYSGAVAGRAYGALRGQVIGRVIILAPSHRARFRGAAVLEVDAFETPLGRVAVDGIVAELSGRTLVQSAPAPFVHEHSVEIQLPFLQRAAPGARVVPLLFGALAESDYPPLVETIASLADDETVYVVSSDFTHYGWRFDYQPFPATDAKAVRARLRALDMSVIEPVLRHDARAFQDVLDTTGATVCGHVPIRTFIASPTLQQPGRLLAYQTSLDVTGDYEHCVSYAAIAFPRAAAVS